MSSPEGKALQQLTAAAEEGKLVAIVGTGVSVALTDGKVPALSWKGLIEDGFLYGQTKGKITAAQSDIWKNQLDSGDLDDLLGAAEFMGRKLGAPNGDLYARWLKNTFEHIKPATNEMAKAVRALNAARIPLCTLNYDTLLESVTGLRTINFGETHKIGEWMRRESQGVLHLHGSWDSPNTCILGIRDYETTIGDDMRDLIQRTLSSFSRLLFIGCGGTFSDPNFSALIRWLREKLKAATPQHYALVSEQDVAIRHTDSAWHGFVDPLDYGPNHADLSEFLLKQFPPPKKPLRKAPANKAASTPTNTKALEDYRAFLLKDCGQMTIEGMRADMDTAQRRFDLERLFVPLKALPTPPEIPLSDPKREQKLREWHEKNSEPQPFGQVFKQHQRLALLALPGGGKSILLKRLAVAYADAARRESSDDELPALDLTPVLIRCREWREHIRRPILVLLKNIDSITGQASLVSLGDALVPLLKTGRVLLLIDGLDEIHNDADRSIFVNHLESFLEEYKQVRLVVTSREAGFSLVAPFLARFCVRWRVAPLDERAITTLCNHWHRLMKGDSPEALRESSTVATYLLQSESLRRLAENPLLLTMLLVVKHGAGGLPPDRVSLYERAVEVLLDTWNIQGHESLNPKEAVPQLAYVAFQLMRQGKQTATEKELLFLLEEAREKVSQIRRYAKDSPDQFLKRVELRSSLLVEAGHQLEGVRTVPFYQFRHLTFQEYLAAVAAVDGLYSDYQKNDTVLTPLASHLIAEEWKEVVPMAGVLAKKHAEPLISALVTKAQPYRQLLEASAPSRRDKFSAVPGAPPPPVARLLQCLVEEAQALPDTLIAALQVMCLFANEPQTEIWGMLCRGPYGLELLHQAWLLYRTMNWPPECSVRNTLANFLAHREPTAYWETEEGNVHLVNLLRSGVDENIARALLTIAALQWGNINRRDVERIIIPVDDVERHLFQKDHSLWHAAVWAWGLIYRRQRQLEPSSAALDRVFALWLDRKNLEKNYPIVSFALGRILGRPRQIWTPSLTSNQKEFVRSGFLIESDFHHREKQASLMIAFYSRDVWPEDELAEKLVTVHQDLPDDDKTLCVAALEQMGKVGAKHLLALATRAEQKGQTRLARKR
ncbi:SIR2 family protein [Bradyrhizobium sp.]